jgi:23S rRNA pseudouridine2604 synthase
MSDIPKTPATKPAVKAIRVIKAPTAPQEPIRLNKRMADLGLCSRREADEWIEQGWVKVNGEIAAVGAKVTLRDRVEVDKRAAGHQAGQVTILINKPMGYVSGQAEDGHEPAVVLIASRAHWLGDSSPHRFIRDHLKGLAPAGRLDIDSTGLLVLTQDGRVARQLIGEDSEVEKEYLVRVSLVRAKDVDNRNLQTPDVQKQFPLEKLNLLRHGISLDGQPLKRAQVEWQNPEQLRFVLKEGKKRQIRRMCEVVGLYVTGLKRVRIGNIKLGQLPVGQWRYLGADERF